MSREESTRITVESLLGLSKTEYLLAEIAISLAQIADKIGCDYEVHTEFVADTDNQSRMITVYHRRGRE